MKFIRRFILMIQFLTTIPLKINLHVSTEDFGKGLVFAPWVGLLVGGILAGAYYVLSMVFPAVITAVFIVVLYIMLTGGLHLDGLGDTFDGLFSNRSRDRILEIMRDSRVGTNAVLAIACVLLINVSVLSSIKSEFLLVTLLLMPAAGRIGSLVGAGVSTYARSGEGLGKSFIDYCGTSEVFAGIVIILPAFWIAAGSKGLVLALFAAVTAFLSVKFFSRKIGGATGDILGAVCELNQTIFLIAVYATLAFLKT